MSKIETGKMSIAREKFDFVEFIDEIISIIYPQAVNQGCILNCTMKSPLSIIISVMSCV